MAVAAGAWPSVLPGIAGVSPGGIFPVSALAAGQRAFSAGTYAVELGGAPADAVSTISGGAAYSDVVKERAGADGIVRKHLSGIKYEDITLEFGTGMSKQFYQWIKSALDRKPQRLDGALVAADASLTEQWRTNFFHGLISEVGFPALDAASKDAARMTVNVSPESTRTAKPGGQLNLGKGGAARKKWLAANFKLQIGELDCTHVNKIEALTIADRAVDQGVGEIRKQLDPGTVEVPNLVITMAESHSQDFYNWHEDFVIKGNNGDAQEKSGTLEFLAPDLSALFTLTLTHLGIFKIGPQTKTSGSESIPRVTAEMYCEHISFDYSASASS